MNAILSEWKAPRYDGSSDVETWLAEIDKGCEKYGIPIKQRVPVALYYMEGEAKIVMEFIRDHEMRTAKKAWRWHKFKKDLVLIHREHNWRHPTPDSPPDGPKDFASEHPFAAAAIRVTLIGVKSVTVVPALAAGILGAVGFTPAGVGARTLAAKVQSMVYGGSTSGLFSSLQSLGATIVAPSLATTGYEAVTAVAGGWFRSGSLTR